MSVQAISAAFAVQGLSPSEKLVLLALANFADSDGRCWPSQARLALDTGLTDRQIRRVFVSLVDAGLMTKEHRRRSDGYRASDLITLTIFEDTVSAKEKPYRTFQDDLTGHLEPILPDTMSYLTTLEPSEEPSVEPRKIDRPREADPFDEFWAAYPRKVGKPKAKAAYQSALRRCTGPPDIMAGLAPWVAAWTDPRFIPHPTTWLTRDGWNDKPEPANVRPDHNSAQLAAREARFAAAFAGAENASRARAIDGDSLSLDRV